MTATRPTTTSAVRYNPVSNNNDNNNNVINNNSSNLTSKRTRGPINKRACQRCRQGKIKCDGDAETGKPCSNCDPQHCKYDNSPRKNKQVEMLKMRLNLVEEQLIAITTEVSDQLNTKDMEKEILCLLYESKEHFTNYQTLFERLRDALKQSRCHRPILPITFELLKRLGNDDNCNQGIMESLQRFVDCANSDISMFPTFPSSAEMFKKIEENYLDQSSYQPNDNVLTMMQQQPLLQVNNSEVDIGHLNLNSGDDDSSESHSAGIDFAENGNAPSTPPTNDNNQQDHSDSKCFNSSNVAQHIVPTSTAQEFVYGDYQFYPNQFNVMDSNNFSFNTMNFLPPTTTSPTDEQIGWNRI